MRSILRSPHFAVVLVAVLYVALLSWASIDRHATFGSSGYDLGIFDQAAWLLGHGHAPFSTVRGRELMADHFQPAIFLLAIFGAVGASPVGLLILQSTVLAAVSPLLYRLARLWGASTPLALAVALMSARLPADAMGEPLRLPSRDCCPAPPRGRHPPVRARPLVGVRGNRRPGVGDERGCLPGLCRLGRDAPLLARATPRRDIV